MRRTEYCLCGESLTLVADSIGMRREFDRWWTHHQGQGHGRATKAECLRARGRAQAARYAARPEE